MPTHIRNSRNASPRQGAEDSGAESGIATLWLVFYVIALGVAISSPLISRAIEFAALLQINGKLSVCFNAAVFRVHVFSSKSAMQGPNLNLLIVVGNFPGVDYVGPLPAELQQTTVFSSGIVVVPKKQRLPKRWSNS